MKKILCILVVTAISATHAMMTPPPANQPMPAMLDMNQVAAPYFQTTPPAMPEQHATMQAMRAMDSQYMVHPEMAAKHMKMLHEAYAAGYQHGHQAGMKQAGQYMQSCLNGMASAMNSSKGK